jgi:hypothetical protein
MFDRMQNSAAAYRQTGEFSRRNMTISHEK